MRVSASGVDAVVQGQALGGALDLDLINDQLRSIPTAATFRRDLTVDRKIHNADLNLANRSVGNSLP